jgi:hypothetical protein
MSTEVKPRRRARSEELSLLLSFSSCPHECAEPTELLRRCCGPCGCAAAAGVAVLPKATAMGAAGGALGDSCALRRNHPLGTRPREPSPSSSRASPRRRPLPPALVRVAAAMAASNWPSVGRADETDRARARARERERVCACVCVCVCQREREHAVKRAREGAMGAVLATARSAPTPPVVSALQRLVASSKVP